MFQLNCYKSDLLKYICATVQGYRLSLELLKPKYLKDPIIYLYYQMAPQTYMQLSPSMGNFT